MIDTKYVYVYLSDHHSAEEYPPKLYVDWYHLRGNLKRCWQTNDSFTFILGAFKYNLYIEFKWNYQEREKTPKEVDRIARIKRIFNESEDV